MPAESGLNEAFSREEWERVIQPQEITSLEEYIKASRLGSGVKLSHKDRKRAWLVFEEYRVVLNEHHLRENEKAMRDAHLVLQYKGYILPYRATVVDEAQDMSAQAFRLSRQMIPVEVR